MFHLFLLLEKSFFLGAYFLLTVIHFNFVLIVIFFLIQSFNRLVSIEEILPGEPSIYFIGTKKANQLSI